MKLLRIFLAVLAAFLATHAIAKPNHIAAELVPERATAAAGQTILLAVSMRPDKGWHGYWENGGDAGFAMRFEWSLPAGASVGSTRYPVPDTLLINGLMNHVYEHDYALLVPFTLPAESRDGETLAITAEADWLACTDEVCVPERGRLATSVRVGSAGPRDARFDGWLRHQPAPLPEIGRFAVGDGALRLAIPLPASLAIDSPHFFARTEHAIDYGAPQRFSRKGDWLVGEFALPKIGMERAEVLSGVLRYGNGEGLEIRAMPGSVPAGGTPLTGSPGSSLSVAGVAAILGGALLGGLLLNVMPCVFPILSLKALSLAQARATPGRARADGLAYTAGSVLACLALGGLMLALRAAGAQIGWAFQLQEPLVVAALLLLTIGITANLAGLFELPALWTATGERGAFATGLLAAFVATPCTGPFMAAAMGAALVLPPMLALGVFAALGLGLALPFLALGFIPALRRALPRPGPWLETFRKAMAAPMALTAAALLWLAWRLAGTAFVVNCLIVAIALIALLVAAGRLQRSGQASGRRIVPGLASLLLLSALVLPRAVAAPERAAGGLPGARAFSQGALASARETGEPVFVYFTADWCLTCKVNEAAAIERESTRKAFERAGVTVLVGDWTRRDPAITRFLAAHGAAGVPLYLWYAPGASAPRILPQVLTPTLLEQAAANS